MIRQFPVSASRDSKKKKKKKDDIAKIKDRSKYIRVSQRLCRTFLFFVAHSGAGLDLGASLRSSSIDFGGSPSVIPFHFDRAGSPPLVVHIGTCACTRGVRLHLPWRDHAGRCTQMTRSRTGLNGPDNMR